MLLNLPHGLRGTLYEIGSLSKVHSDPCFAVGHCEAPAMTRSDRNFAIALCGSGFLFVALFGYERWTVYIAPPLFEAAFPYLWIGYGLPLLLLPVYAPSRARMISSSWFERGVVVVGCSLLLGMGGAFATYGAASLGAKVAGEPVGRCYRVIEQSRTKFNLLHLREINDAGEPREFKLRFKRYLLDMPGFQPGDYAWISGTESFFGINVEKIERAPDCTTYNVRGQVHLLVVKQERGAAYWNRDRAIALAGG